MNSLIIGNTSQLSYYFPKEYERISSRNIELTNNQYDRVYICFAEQRTYIKDNPQIFFDTNVEYTLKLIDHYSKLSNYIIVYGSSELWNNCNGSVDINTSFNYKPSHYCDSKKLMIEKIKENSYKNVIVLHPFNFNSIYRKEGFLFYKIFNSIINEEKITIGNTYFYRELLHPKFVVEQSMKFKTDNIIGTGRLFFVNDFIRSLYSYFNMEYEYFVTEDYKENISEQNIFYLKTKQIINNNLFDDTIEDIKKLKKVNE